MTEIITTTSETVVTYTCIECGRLELCICCGCASAKVQITVEPKQPKVARDSDEWHWSRRDFPRREWVLFWDDGKVIREVRTKSFYETWDQSDRELAERERLPKEMRKELSR